MYTQKDLLFRLSWQPQWVGKWRRALKHIKKILNLTEHLNCCSKIKNVHSIERWYILMFYSNNDTHIKLSIASSTNLHFLYEKDLWTVLTNENIFGQLELYLATTSNKSNTFLPHGMATFSIIFHSKNAIRWKTS